MCRFLLEPPGCSPPRCRSFWSFSPSTSLETDCAMRPTLMAERTTSHVLSVRDLAVDFVQDTGTIRALEGVSLDLHAGRVLGVVGESGCGKSVTARAILRLLDRTGRIGAGQVLLEPGSEEELDLTALDPEGKQMREVRGGR